MLDHLGLDVADYERSKAFYARALAPLGIKLIMEPVAEVGGFGDSHMPYFWIGRRGRPAQTGVHIAFAAASREHVDAFHAPRRQQRRSRQPHAHPRRNHMARLALARSMSAQGPPRRNPNLRRREAFDGCLRRARLAWMVDASTVRRIALGLPEAVEQDHHGRPSFRVGGRIFATLWDAGHVNVMLDEPGIRTAVEDDRQGREEVWWGRRLAAVRLDLGATDADEVAELLADAWDGKAPKRLLARRDSDEDGSRGAGQTTAG